VAELIERRWRPRWRWPTADGALYAAKNAGCNRVMAA
jgi:hypothetical protein